MMEFLRIYEAKIQAASPFIKYVFHCAEMKIAPDDNLPNTTASIAE